ncbi:MAG: hypothetical protein HKN00_06340 [Flavobacteriaceae bacterium]|nr:hypothetical protein [Bacteroidia bacterium]NNF74784.1 hypothetical protein [Flavobacteriaceae bacterium]
MFLKRFKEKSNKKYFNNVLNQAKRTVPAGKIEAVGILLNFDEFNRYDQLRIAMKNIGFKDNKVRFIAFLEDDKEKPNSWDDFYSEVDFGWKGKIKNPQLEDFISTKFDALISYYKDPIPELDYVTALSNAHFKIGISNHDHRLFDLIIDIESKYLSVFEKELNKYLKVLNKI